MANQDDFIRTALRVPPDLHKQIHDAARASNRTFNAEIVARLQASFSDQSSPPKYQASEISIKINQKLLAEMFSKLDNLDAEVKALPVKLRQIPEGTKVIKDKIAIIKHLGEDPTNAMKKRTIRKKKEDDTKS